GDVQEDREMLTLLGVSVRHESRELCDLQLETRFGPVFAVVEHPELRPSADWDDVVRGPVFDEVVAVTEAAARELFNRICAGFERSPAVARRWLASILLHAAAVDPELRRQAHPLPLLPTVDGDTLSLARAAELVGGSRKLEYVGRELGSAPIEDPPIIVVDESQLDDLRALFGDVLVDASDRVRHHRIYDRLDDCAPMTEAKLDPEQILVSLPLGGDGWVAEVGIPRDREKPGLQLRCG